MSNNKVDEFHLHEVVDRTHVLQVMLHELLEGHPAMTPSLNIHFKTAAKALHDLYQLAGHMHLGEGRDY